MGCVDIIGMGGSSVFILLALVVCSVDIIGIGSSAVLILFTWAVPLC